MNKKSLTFKKCSIVLHFFLAVLLLLSSVLLFCTTVESETVESELCKTTADRHYVLCSEKPGLITAEAVLLRESEKTEKKMEYLLPPSYDDPLLAGEISRNAFPAGPVSIIAILLAGTIILSFILYVINLKKSYGKALLRQVVERDARTREMLASSYASLLKEELEKEKNALGRTVAEKLAGVSTILLKISQIASTLERSRLFDRVIDLLVNELGAARCGLYLYCSSKNFEGTDSFLFLLREFSYYESEKVPEIVLGKDREYLSLIDYAARTNQIINVNNAGKDVRLRGLIKKGVVETVLAVPIHYDNELRALINIAEIKKGYDIDVIENVMKPLSGILGSIFNSVDLYNEIEDELKLRKDELAGAKEETRRALERISRLENLSAEEVRRKTLLRKNFGRFISPALLEALALEEREWEPGQASEQEVTVLFSDVANFTTISEKLDKSILFKFINEYFDSMSAIIMKSNGMINKYIGDGIMAVFGAPLASGNVKIDALNAVKAACLMVKELHLKGPEWRKKFGFEPKTRIGINTGRVRAGTVGGRDRFEYTVIGDGVNLASRLEGENKKFGTEIIISRSTYELVKEEIEALYLGETRVKGRKGWIGIYQVLGMTGEQPVCEAASLDPVIFQRSFICSSLKELAQLKGYLDSLDGSASSPFVIGLVGEPDILKASLERKSRGGYLVASSNVLQLLGRDVSYDKNPILTAASGNRLHSINELFLESESEIRPALSGDSSCLAENSFDEILSLISSERKVENDDSAGIRSETLKYRRNGRNSDSGGEVSEKQRRILELGKKFLEKSDRQALEELKKLREEDGDREVRYLAGKTLSALLTHTTHDRRLEDEVFVLKDGTYNLEAISNYLFSFRKCRIKPCPGREKDPSPECEHTGLRCRGPLELQILRSRAISFILKNRITELKESLGEVLTEETDPELLSQLLLARAMLIEPGNLQEATKIFEILKRHIYHCSDRVRANAILGLYNLPATYSKDVIYLLDEAGQKGLLGDNRTRANAMLVYDKFGRKDRVENLAKELFESGLIGSHDSLAYAASIVEYDSSQTHIQKLLLSPSASVREKAYIAAMRHGKKELLEVTDSKEFIALFGKERALKLRKVLEKRSSLSQKS